jgi:hypothetical protein
MWDGNDLHDQPEKIYVTCLDLLDQYLRIIQRDGREPDLWERINLNTMLNDLNRGQIHLALTAFRNAITPPDNQSPDYPIDADEAAQHEGLDLTYFWKCVAQLRSRSLPVPQV